MMSQALLKANLEVLHDRKGRTLFSHVAAVILYRCKPVEVKIWHDERKCCVELPVWMGSNFTTSAFVQPTSKRVTLTCTPRICNSFDTPLFNVGTTRIPRWIRISKFGEIIQSEAPQDFIPQSNNKEDQIVLRQSSVYRTKQRKEFQKFSLIKNARDLVDSEIIYKMFPPASMEALDEKIESPSFCGA